MSRDWDKLRRQAKTGAHDRYSEIQHRLQYRPIKHKRFRVRRPKLFTQSPPAPISPKLLVKFLEIEINSVPILTRWERKQGVWHCLFAPFPIDWFTRIRHPDVIWQWLMKNHHPYRWLKADAVPSNLPEQAPAEAYTPNKASVPQGDNTCSSLNTTDSQHSMPGAEVRLSLEQNGVTSPRCLIPSGCPDNR